MEQNERGGRRHPAEGRAEPAERRDCWQGGGSGMQLTVMLLAAMPLAAMPLAVLCTGGAARDTHGPLSAVAVPRCTREGDG